MSQTYGPAQALMEPATGRSTTLSHPVDRAPRAGVPWSHALYAAIALGVLLIAAPRTSLNPRSRLPDMVHGTAFRPYVKRALVPLAVQALDAALPAAARDSLTSLTRRSPALQRRLGWPPEFASLFMLVFLIHGAALMLFAVWFRRLLESALEVSAAVAALAAAVALALVPIHFGFQNFIYDFPALALFTLGAALVVERRWTAFYLLWPIGLLNKETFVLLSLVFVITQRRTMPRARLLVHLAAQLGSAAAIWLALAWAFRSNPGVALEWHLLRNLNHLPPPRQRLHDLVYASFCVYAFWGWGAKRTLAAAAVAVGGVLVASTLFFGFLGEYRDDYEVFPLLAVMAVHTTLSAFGRRPALTPALGPG